MIGLGEGIVRPRALAGLLALALALSTTAALGAPPARAAEGTIIAVQGPDESLDVYSRADASTAWSESVVAGPGTTAGAPAAARFQSGAGQQGTEVAATSPTGALEIYTNIDGQSGWASSPVAGSGAASSGPALVRFDNSEGELGSIVAAEGPNDSLAFDYAVDGQAAWTASSPGGTGTAFGTPAMVRFNNSSGQQGTVLTTLGPNDSLDFYYNVDGSPNWDQATIAGTGSTFGTPAVVRYNNSAGQQGTLVSAPGPDDSLDFYYNADGDQNWGQATIGPTGSTFGDPAMVRYNSSTGQQGTLISATGANDSLDFYYNVDNVSHWGEAAIAGAGTTFSDPAMARTVADDGTQGTAIAVEGPDGTLELYTNVDNVSAWTADEVAGPGSAASAPAIVRSDDLAVTSAPSGTGTTALPPPSRGHAHRRRLNVSMEFTWRFVHGTTRLKSVRIGRLPHAASIAFSWRLGPRHHLEKARAGRVKGLERRMRGRTFRAGEHIYVRVTASHRLAQRDEIMIRAGRLPRMRSLDRR